VWAMFVKINGKWQFSGFQEHDERATEFEERVAEDIEKTADMEVKTEASRLVWLED
jgi:hypothetical protein